MARVCSTLRTITTTVLSLGLISAPVLGESSAALGTVVSAERAHVGLAAASVGTTIFGGDQLDTEHVGRLQVRTATARLVLSGSSRVTWGVEGETPAAILKAGTTTFSTANAKAFALRMSSAVIRPEGDAPTIGTVTVINPKELTVRCSRGALTISVEDDTRVIPEGTAYHVVLDPDARRIAEASVPGGQKPPKVAGRSKFIWYAIGAAAVVTYFAVSEVMESPDRP